MNYVLSTDELKEKFGDIRLEIISQQANERISCTRRVSDNTILTYNVVTFDPKGISALGDELHSKILTGDPIGEVIKNSSLPHKRIASDFFQSKIDSHAASLFQTKNDTCRSRTVNYTIKDLPYASIREFYNPELF